jgi:hypothetical protein
MNNLNANQAKAVKATKAKEQKEAKAVKAKEQKEAKDAKAKEQKEAKEAKEAKAAKDMEDDYTEDILRDGYYSFKKYRDDSRKRHPMVRLPNMPEDISENITKFLIHIYGGDPNIKWAKAITINGKRVKGDLYSSNYPLDSQPEVKSFASDGPLTFGPKKKFGVLYCLDLTGAFDKNNFYSKILIFIIIKCLRQQVCGLKIEVDKRNQTALHGSKNRVKFLIIKNIFKLF